MGQGSFKFQIKKLSFKVEKCSMVMTSPNLTFLLEITDAMSSGLKRRETFQRVISVQFKSQHFRATYAPLQTTCISEGQCKTTYCSHYNSMVEESGCWIRSTCSPAILSIENIWRIIKQKRCPRWPQILQQLETYIRQEWDKIPTPKL